MSVSMQFVSRKDQRVLRTRVRDVVMNEELFNHILEKLSSVFLYMHSRRDYLVNLFILQNMCYAYTPFKHYVRYSGYKYWGRGELVSTF